MYRACIAIVDASRARLFTFERTSGVDGIHEQLIEQHDLVDPARRLRPSDLFSDARPGTGWTAGLSYGFDDRRDAQLEQMDASFARDVVTEITNLIRSSGARRLILCASPNMLGQLRQVGSELRRDGLVLDELPRDLVRLTTPDLRDRLAAYSLLPQLPTRHGLSA